MNNLLDVRNICKSFSIRNGFRNEILRAVQNVSFQMYSNKPSILAIAGESGSGKSTIAKLILGLEKISSGSIHFKGRDISQISKKEKRNWLLREIQPVFQDPFASFSPLKKIESYLFETYRNFKIGDEDSYETYINNVLSKVGLTFNEVKSRYPNELSGGQAQRIAVARALISKPSLIIADEPVSMLDASLRISIVNMFIKLKQHNQISFIYITHDLTTAYYSADNIIIMKEGEIVETGSVDNVLRDPQHEYTQNLIASIPKITDITLLLSLFFRFHGKEYFVNIFLM